ncbi:MAG: hypothetical protein KBT47_03665 [Armatimonadetes bacterium]|nr:hypothetical protein [Candidatus Hippobium faecium]
MNRDKILLWYFNLSAFQKKIFFAVLLLVILFILYFIGFFIAKSIITEKIKVRLAENGIGTSADNIELKISANPFTCLGGVVNSVYFRADQVNVKNFLLIHDLEIKTKKLNIKNISNFAEGGITSDSSGILISCNLYENDFLSLLKEKLSSLENIGASCDISSNLGFITISTEFPFKKEIKAEPYLYNNAIYLRFTDGFLAYMPPVKLVDFGLVSRNRLNVYAFEYQRGVYSLKGTLI